MDQHEVFCHAHVLSFSKSKPIFFLFLLIKCVPWSVLGTHFLFVLGLAGTATGGANEFFIAAA